MLPSGRERSGSAGQGALGSLDASAGRGGSREAKLESSLRADEPQRLLDQLEAQRLHRLEDEVESALPGPAPLPSARGDLEIAHEIQRQHADRLPGAVGCPVPANKWTEERLEAVG